MKLSKYIQENTDLHLITQPHSTLTDKLAYHYFGIYTVKFTLQFKLISKQYDNNGILRYFFFTDSCLRYIQGMGF